MKNNRMYAGFGLGLALSVVILLGGCASNVPAPVFGRDGQPVLTQPENAAKDTYTVKSGDTIYSIAREHGMDFRELIALNGIDNPSRIVPGRVLKIKPPAPPPTEDVTTSPITTDVVISRPIDDVAGAPPRADTGMLKREPKAGKEPYSDEALALAQNQGAAKPADSVVPAAKPDDVPEPKAAEPALEGDELAWIWPAVGKTVGTFSEAGNKGVDIAGKAGDPVIAAGEGKVVYSGTGLRGYGKLVIIKHNATYLSAYAHNQTILVKEGQSVSKGQKIAEMGNTDADQVKLHFEVRRQGKPVDPLKYLPQR
jgi:lipoprotein NlpD